MREAAVAEHVPVWNPETERRHIHIRQDGSEDTELQKPPRNHAAAERETDCERNCGMCDDRGHAQAVAVRATSRQPADFPFAARIRCS